MLLTGVALAALLAPACGSGDDGEPAESTVGGQGAPEPTASPDEELSQVPPPAAGRPSRPPARPTDRLSPVTVRGRLAEPSAGCLVVEADNGPWALVGDVPADLAPGTEVEVTGRPAPEAETGCGAPALRVGTIRPLRR